MYTLAFSAARKQISLLLSLPALWKRLCDSSHFRWSEGTVPCGSDLRLSGVSVTASISSLVRFVFLHLTGAHPGLLPMFKWDCLSLMFSIWILCMFLISSPSIRGLLMKHFLHPKDCRIFRPCLIALSVFTPVLWGFGYYASVVCFEIGNYDSSNIFLLVQDGFVVWALVCFHLCFKNVRHSSVQNVLGGLMVFALNLHQFVSVNI